jgi:hypothetical protein
MCLYAHQTSLQRAVPVTVSLESSYHSHIASYSEISTGQSWPRILCLVRTRYPGFVRAVHSRDEILLSGDAMIALVNTENQGPMSHNQSSKESFGLFRVNVDQTIQYSRCTLTTQRFYLFRTHTCEGWLILAFFDMLGIGVLRHLFSR